MANQLGALIAKLREEKDISTEQLASAAGLEPGTLTAIERGDIAAPPVERLQRIANRLGVPLKRLQDAVDKSAKEHQTDEIIHNSDFNNQWIEIFRAGDYGDKGKWGRGDLAKVVANFKAGTWTPPAVIGHPKNDSPAMGWVEDLAQDGDLLKARFKQVQPELEAHARDGRFPNRSAAFYLDPKGSGPVLRHVGFLGATPPEVKGMAPIQFSDGEFVAIDFQEGEMDEQQIKKTVATSIREFFSGLFAEKKTEEQTFTEDDVKRLIEAANKPLLEANQKLSEKFEESVKKANDAAAAATADARKQSAAELVKSLQASNRWVPAFSEAGLDKVIEHLAVSGGIVKFGEAGKEKEASYFDLMKAFLEGLPKIVPTGRITMDKKGDNEMEPHLVARKAQEYQETQRQKGITVSATEAVTAVMSK